MSRARWDFPKQEALSTAIRSFRFCGAWATTWWTPWALTDQRRLDAVCAMPYGPERRDEWRRLNAQIARTNHAAIDRCDALVAVLDGADVDSGTAAEIGYAFARGKPIIGYRGDV